MNYLDATFAFLEDASDIVLKAPERDDDGIGHPSTPVPSREPMTAKAPLMRHAPTGAAAA